MVPQSRALLQKETESVPLWAKSPFSEHSSRLHRFRAPPLRLLWLEVSLSQVLATTSTARTITNIGRSQDNISSRSCKNDHVDSDDDDDGGGDDDDDDGDGDGGDDDDDADRNPNWPMARCS